MNSIVTLHHNEPMTTSLAIASGVELQHKNVLELIYKHIDSLSEFGEVGTSIVPAGESSEYDSANSAFHKAADGIGQRIETRNSRSTRGRPTEVVYLNEQQATFLVTLMRNSEIVVRFKVALVRAFFEMRDTVRGQRLETPHFTTTNLSHGADLAVAADRTFRGFLRAARATGLSLPNALRVANQQTIDRTGMDMLAALNVTPEDIEARHSIEESAPPELVTLAQWAAAAESGKLYTMDEILLSALGVSRDSAIGRKLQGRAGDILKNHGFRVFRARIDGRQPARYWTKR